LYSSWISAEAQYLFFQKKKFSRLIFSSSYYCIGTLVDGSDLKFKNPDY
jgi:hypothetical protein